MRENYPTALAAVLRYEGGYLLSFHLLKRGGDNVISVAGGNASWILSSFLISSKQHSTQKVIRDTKGFPPKQIKHLVALKVALMQPFLTGCATRIIYARYKVETSINRLKTINVFQTNLAANVVGQLAAKVDGDYARRIILNAVESCSDVFASLRWATNALNAANLFLTMFTTFTTGTRQKKRVLRAMSYQAGQCVEWQRKSLSVTYYAQTVIG
jgi:hypothetical protein